MQEQCFLRGFVGRLQILQLFVHKDLLSKGLTASFGEDIVVGNLAGLHFLVALIRNMKEERLFWSQNRKNGVKRAYDKHFKTYV